jgi:hypothetical protein
MARMRDVDRTARQSPQGADRGVGMSKLIYQLAAASVGHLSIGLEPIVDVRHADDASAKHGVPIEIVFAVLCRESYGGLNIYGHDAGAAMTVPGVNVTVTRKNYARYCQLVDDQGKRANGIGPMQITYRPDQLEADKRGGVIIPEVNIDYGVELLAGYVSESPNWAVALGKYNGGPSNPDMSYGDAVYSLAHNIRLYLDTVTGIKVLTG